MLGGRPSPNACCAPSPYYPNVQVTVLTPAQGPNDGPMVHVYPSVETSETAWPPKATISQKTLKDVSEK